MAFACEIDWAALGTWVAVALALWLTQRDKSEAKAQRKAEAVILAVIIEPELALMQVRLDDIRRQVDLEGEARDWLEANLVASREARRQLGSQGQGLDTPTLRQSVDRLFALPPEFSQSMAQALTAIAEVKHDLLTMRDEESDETARALYGEYVPMLLDHLATAETLTKIALKNCDALIPQVETASPPPPAIPKT